MHQRVPTIRRFGWHCFDDMEMRFGTTTLPVHSILIVQQGIHIIEVLNLEALARDRVVEFVFVAARLRIVDATGSPLRRWGS
jgi:kynurenine formamidase